MNVFLLFYFVVSNSVCGLVGTTITIGIIDSCIQLQKQFNWIKINKDKKCYRWHCIRRVFVLAIQINLLDCPLSIPSAIICLCALLNFNTKKKQFLFHCFPRDKRHTHTKEREYVHFDLVCFFNVITIAKRWIQIGHWFSVSHCAIRMWYFRVKWVNWLNENWKTCWNGGRTHRYDTKLKWNCST